MKRSASFLLLLLSLAVYAKPQKAAKQKSPDAKISQVVAACKTLGTIASLVDGTFDGEKNATTILTPMLTYADDSIWDALIDCSETTKKPAENAEALRVAAIWERLRAEGFRKAYIAEQPRRATACETLDQLKARVKAVTVEEPTATTKSVPDYDSISNGLLKCANDTIRLNTDGHPSSEGWAVSMFHELQEWELRRQRESWKAAYDDLLVRANELVKDYNSLLDKHNSFVATVSEHERSGGAYIQALQHFAFFEAIPKPNVRCTGTFYSYGTWGTVTSGCQ